MLFAFSTLSAAEPAPKAFDIPAGTAEQALKAFSAQSGQEVLFATATTGKVRTNAVKGNYTPTEALGQLLKGTGLVAARDQASGTFSVTRDPNVQRAAQPAPSDRPVGNRPNSAEPAEDTILELSPFTVNAEQDTGYVASGTLAGSRLRMELKDVAASISAVTKEFMEDINANDLEGLLTYTLGTEVAGPGGNFTNTTENARFGNFDEANSEPTSGTRIRGLGSADNTRDYFLTSIPMDGYNTDRVEISRGPNAMLFGLGAPAGIINRNTIRADLRRTKTKVSAQTGSHGTYRTSLDHSQLLIKDKLALRTAAVYQDRRYRIEEAYAKDRRAFLTATYRPFRHTTIRANVELGDRDFNTPVTRPPFDSFTYWWDTGKPGYNPITNEVTLFGTPTPGYPMVRGAAGGPGTGISGFQFGDVQWQTAVIYSDPNSSVAGIPGQNTAAFKTVATRGRVTSPTNPALVQSGLRTMSPGVTFMRALHPGFDMAFWRWAMISDPRIFDFYHHQLIGPNGDGYTRFNTHNVSLEQQLLDGRVGFELTYDSQDLAHMIQRPEGNQEYSLLMDINTKLLDGSDNPNFARPFTAGSGNKQITDTGREALRATAYYNLNLTKVGSGWLGRFLGQHTLTGAYTEQEVDVFSRSAPIGVVGLDYELFAFGTIVGKNSASTRLGRMSYLGPNLLGSPGPQNAGIQNITAHQLPTNDPLLYSTSAVPPNVNSPLATWAVRPFGVVMPADRGDVGPVSAASKSRSEYTSSILVATSRWLENTLVTTVGWRRDEYKMFSATDAPFDPATGLRMIGPNEFPLRPRDKGAVQKTNYGVALHAPGFIKRRLPLEADFTLYYNRSDNFSPGAQRYSVWGTPIDPEKGETKEYAVRLSLFNGKFELRGTYYETGANLARGGTPTDQPINQALLRVEYGLEHLREFEANPAQAAGADAFKAWLQTPGAQRVLEVFRFESITNAGGGVTVDHDRRANEVVGTTDTVSKGYEFEAIFNPTRSWRIAFNATQQKAVKDNTGRDVARWIDEVFTPLFINSAFGDTPSGAQINTVRQTVQGPIYQNLRRNALLDGSRAPELREWRWNAVTNYTVREGRLKGWSIGGAVRWQAEGAIGYPVIDDGFGGGVIDVKNPYMAPGQTDYDGWLRYTRRIGRRFQWTAQLNIKNIGVGNELITVQTQPDGTGSAFRIREPQNWALSSTLSF